MTTQPKSRVSAGVREGGQFATEARQESTVSLSALSPHVRGLVENDLRERRARAADGYAEAARREQVAHTMLRDATLALEAAQDRVTAAEKEVRDAERELQAAERIMHDVGATPAGESPEPDAPATPYQGPKHVDDVVLVPGQGQFRRVPPDYLPTGDFDGIRVQVDRELSADEARHLAQLVGYQWAGTGGERLPEPVQDAPNSIVLYADSTKTRSMDRVDGFVVELDSTVREGSPVRTTNRAGAGTQGTRLVEALPSVGDVHLYFRYCQEFPVGS